MPDGRPYKAGNIQSEIGRTAESVWECPPGADGHGNGLAAARYERRCGRMARPLACPREESALAGLSVEGCSGRLHLYGFYPTHYI